MLLVYPIIIIFLKKKKTTRILTLHQNPNSKFAGIAHEV